MSKAKSKNKVPFNLDKLFVDIATADTLEAVKYYDEVAMYLKGLAELHKAQLQMTGYGAFVSGKFYRQFPSSKEAHEACISRIVLIHECDKDDIDWEDNNWNKGIGTIRQYWIGERPFYLYDKAIAEIATVNEEGGKLHALFGWNKLPDTPTGLIHKTADEAELKLSHLVQDNFELQSELNRATFRYNNAYARIKASLEYSSDTFDELKGALARWLNEHKPSESEVSTE